MARTPESGDRRSSDSQALRLEFYHVLGLSPLGPLDHLKLHFLVFRQGAEAVALDGAVMHKDIRPLSRVIKPKPLESLNHFTLPVSFIAEKPPTKSTANIPLKKQGASSQAKKKSARELASPSDSCPGLLPCLQSDMLNYQIY